MNKKDYQMLVLDIDGTLLNSKKEITPKTKEMLLRIQKAGKKVVLASGRPTPGITKVADELELDRNNGYILSFNGGRVIDYETGEIIYNRTVPLAFVPELYRTAIELGTAIVTYTESEIILGTESNQYCEFESRICGIPLRRVDNFVEFVDFPVNKLLLPGEPDIVLKAQNVLRESVGWELGVYRSEPFFLEIVPQSIDKANSIGRLLEHLGMQREQVICCGDGFNDISMMEYAGLGVAMGNAQDEVKAAADYVTASNDEEGIVQVIEKFMMQD